MEGTENKRQKSKKKERKKEIGLHKINNRIWNE